LNAQLSDLLIAYLVTAGSMLTGLLMMRADTRAYWRWPVYSAMAMALAVLSWNLFLRHMLPAAWSFTHPRALYFCALGLYLALGLALGILLGRLTGRKTPESNSRDES
jgi:hypothetical protein